MPRIRRIHVLEAQPMRLIFILALVVFGVAATFSRVRASPNPQIDSRQRAVDQIFAAYNTPNSPGCAVGVIQNGNFVYRKAYGMASLELSVPLSSDSVFYMGSVSKQFTAASIVLAAEQGYLSLDDDVHKYIPELPSYGHTIALRQMLHHTSGLRELSALASLAGENLSDLDAKTEVMNLITHQKELNFTPGEEYEYTNTNYFLLAEVVKRATKKSLAEFANENIFRPLGMIHTRFYDDASVVLAGRVPAYDPGEDGKFVVDWSTTYDLVGAGGLMSNVDDLLFWDRNFYANKLGKGTLTRELQTPATLNNGRRLDYGLGLELTTYRGLRRVWHEGGAYGYRTALLRFPDQRFSVVVLCNLSRAMPAPITSAQKIADLYLATAFSNSEPSTLDPSDGARALPDPTPFAGEYLDPRTHTLYSFTAENGTLKGWGETLRRVGATEFRDLGGNKMTFDSTKNGEHLSLIYLNQLFFSGSRITRPKMSEAALEEFVGAYRSAELGVTYRLSVANGSLVLRQSSKLPIKMDALAKDEFENDGVGSVVFQRDANRHVSGFGVFTNGVRDLKFTKIQ